MTRIEEIAEAMSPGCMKCEAVTGKATCFPGPCVFYHERNTPDTKAHQIATLDRIRRSGGPVRAATDLYAKGECDGR